MTLVPVNRQNWVSPFTAVRTDKRTDPYITILSDFKSVSLQTLVIALSYPWIPYHFDPHFIASARDCRFVYYSCVVRVDCVTDAQGDAANSPDVLNFRT